MKQNKDIEQLFRTEFESFGVQPSPKVWKGVRNDLFFRNFFRFSPYSVNAWYAAGVLIVGTVLVLSVLGTAGKGKSEMLNGKGQRENVESLDNGNLDSKLSEAKSQITGGKIERSEIPQSGRENVESLDNRKLDGKLSEAKSQITGGKIERSEIPQSGSEKVQIPDKGNYELAVSENITTEKEIPDSQDREVNHGQNFAGQSVLAYFQCSANSGCGPLSVHFQNYSQNAVRYSWTFGDGGSSELASPSYIFDEPGTWFVSLTAFSSTNEVSLFTDSIKVNPKPVARFSMDVQGMPGEGQPVYFYNYSLGAENFLWNFGDGNTSNLKEPNHYFSKKTKTDISLLAVSSAGCSDSTVLKDAFKTGEPALIFPTAFSPNTSGPGTGQYTLKNPQNDVFYPFVEEEPVEYQLRIFNRNGIQIFESNDIHIGWDGYYKEELQVQGVYVWKARAKFADGRSVVKMGDVTLLWE